MMSHPRRFVFYGCIYSPSDSQSSNTPASSDIRSDSNVSSKYFARSALSLLGTGRPSVSGLRRALKRKVASASSCPTRLHDPSKLSDPFGDKSGLRCRHRTGLNSNHAPNARQKGVSFSRLRTRSAGRIVRGLVTFRLYSLHPERFAMGTMSGFVLT